MEKETARYGETETSNRYPARSLPRQHQSRCLACLQCLLLLLPSRLALSSPYVDDVSM